MEQRNSSSSRIPRVLRIGETRGIETDRKETFSISVPVRLALRTGKAQLYKRVQRLLESSSSSQRCTQTKLKKIPPRGGHPRIGSFGFSGRSVRVSDGEGVFVKVEHDRCCASGSEI